MVWARHSRYSPREFPSQISAWVPINDANPSRTLPAPSSLGPKLWSYCEVHQRALRTARHLSGCATPWNSVCSMDGYLDDTTNALAPIGVSANPLDLSSRRR